MDRLKGFMHMRLGLRIIQIVLELTSLTTIFLPKQNLHWTYSVYGAVHKILPDKMPEPLGEAVVTTITLLLDDFILSTKHLLIGITIGKPLLRQLHMVLSLLLQKQQQNRL